MVAFSPFLFLARWTKATSEEKPLVIFASTGILHKIMYEKGNEPNSFHNRLAIINTNMKKNCYRQIRALVYNIIVKVEDVFKCF